MNKDMDNIKQSIKKDRLIAQLKHAIDAENTISICYSHLASLIKNGRIRNRFRAFSGEANTDKELLSRQLKNRGVNDFVQENKCKICRINPESFSLIGAVNLGLEITNEATRFYKHLSGLSINPEDKRLFKRLQREKIKQRVFLKREREFSSKDENRPNLIDNYCIPKAVSTLWK